MAESFLVCVKIGIPREEKSRAGWCCYVCYSEKETLTALGHGVDSIEAVDPEWCRM
jgi:hypothetical protein